MPQETPQQPFAGDQSRSTADTELVEGVLGEQAADEMTELAGDANKKGPVATSKLKISATESDATRKIEQAASLKQRRQEYIEFVEDYGLSERWVDNNFKFNDDGTVEFLGKFECSYYNNTDSFPDSLKVFKNSVDLRECKWSKQVLESLKGKKIEGNLIVDGSDTEMIPEGITCYSILLLMSTTEFKVNTKGRMKFEQEIYD